MRPLKDADGSYASRPYGLTTGLENQALDLLFQVRDVRRPQQRMRGFSEPITIIEVDEAAIKASGVRLQKWPRDWYARLVDRASEGGATVIGLDFFLSEAGGRSTEDAKTDQQLAESIANAGNVVVAMKLDAGGYEAINPLPMYGQAAWATGFVDVPVDNDGFVRSLLLFRARPGENTEFSFATRVVEGHLLAQAYSQKLTELQGRALSEEAAADEAAQYAQQKSEMKPWGKDAIMINERVIALRNDNTLQLDYRTRPPAFRRISAADLLFNDQAQISDDLFRDRIVLIGSTNIDAPDLFPTPFYEASWLPRLLDRRMPTAPARTPGVELHATAAATMLFGNTLTRPRYRWQVSLLLLPLVFAALAVFRLRALWALLAVFLLALAVLVVALLAFSSRGMILPLATTWLGLVLLAPTGLGLRYAREHMLLGEKEAERAQVMDILSRCVSQNVAEELWQRRDQIVSGERRIVTIMFTDIRNFTTLSETAASDDLVEWLNDYFSRMHESIEAHCGHIDKFIGDGLMIVFGAPASRGDEAEARAAVACGLQMLDEVERMNEEWKELDRPQIRIGVGIHTGEATCGVVGAERRLEYTVIGDTVNLAARLESTTKEYGVPLLISEATARLLNEDFEAHALGEVKVKGKNASTRIYTVKQRNPL